MQQLLSSSGTSGLALHDGTYAPTRLQAEALNMYEQYFGGFAEAARILMVSY